MTVSVPPNLESAVRKLAKRQHRTVSELVRHALRQYLGSAEREARRWRLEPTTSSRWPSPGRAPMICSDANR